MVDPSSSGSGSSPTVPGSPADLRRLVADHYQDVYRYAFRLTGNSSDAEDLTQQTFLIAQQKLHQLRAAEKALSWLFAVLRSCFLKLVGRTLPLLVDSLDDNAAQSEPTLFDLVGVDSESLQQALLELADEYRLVVMMFYFEELSYKEIAEQLQIPMGTVMSRLARAKARLREQLLSAGSDPVLPSRKL